MSMKNPLTPAGIEPATFRFVAQHLNHCATAVPYSVIYTYFNQIFRSLSVLLHNTIIPRPLRFCLARF